MVDDNDSEKCMMMRMAAVRHIELRLFPDLFAYFNLGLTITPGEERLRRNKYPISMIFPVVAKHTH